MDSMETLFFTILDTLTDNIMPVVDHIEERLEDFQHKVFEKFSPAILEEIFELKKWVLRLKRFMIPQREIIIRLTNSAHPMFHGEWQFYLRDVRDHTEKVLDHLEIYEQLFPDAMSTYLNQVTNRMNEVMKTMSIIATLMLPLSFITGIFGMNFQSMPLVGDGLAGFWTTIGFMTLLFIGMVTYFKRKDWF
jgi:magnesium transporter